MPHIQQTPTSRCRIGIGLSDITPPVGIYHRFWGAAKHDRATGVHRPLRATVLILEPLNATESNETQTVIALDHCILRPPEMQELTGAVCRLIGEDEARVTITFSHTHSGGNLCRDRVDLPGGDLIAPYLDALPAQIAAACQAARNSLQPATLTYGTAICAMGRQRDFWDESHGRYVCGYNPDGISDQTVSVARAMDESGQPLATVVNYGCHPTTLAWDNTLISPDYIGALRDTLEEQTQAPCLFLLSPCGDIGPREGFVGDPKVADRNGRQVAFAALSVLESLPDSGHDYHYAGPVLSGATLGEWKYRPQQPEREATTALFRRRCWDVPLNYLEGLPTAATVRDELAALIEQESQARAAGDESHAHDLRVMAERQRRLLERVAPLPSGESYPFHVSVTQIGDAFWVDVEGEPYNFLQAELHRRFPDRAILITVLEGGARASYLPTRDCYGQPLYQAEIALLAAGALETVTDAIAAQITAWTTGDA